MSVRWEPQGQDGGPPPVVSPAPAPAHIDPGVCNDIFLIKYTAIGVGWLKAGGGGGGEERDQHNVSVSVCGMDVCMICICMVCATCVCGLYVACLGIVCVVWMCV